MHMPVVFLVLMLFMMMGLRIVTVFLFFNLLLMRVMTPAGSNYMPSVGFIGCVFVVVGVWSLFSGLFDFPNSDGE
jgi:hypothetical protein